MEQQITKNHSEYGQLNGQLLRVADADYADGVSTLAGGSRANSRDVSNALMDQHAGPAETLII